MMGSTFGLDNLLWGYTFASLIFPGALGAYLPVGITILLLSTAIIAGGVGLTSKIPAHVATLEEGAIGVIGTVAVMANAHIGDFASVDAAAATIFVIMAISTLLIGAGYLLIARFNLGLLIQLMPFPVVCGFLAGVGWLFFTAGISMTTGIDFEITEIGSVLTMGTLSHWVPALACGLTIYVLMERIEHSLILPASLVVLAGGFFAIVAWNGASLDTLRAGGWLFDLTAGTASKGIGDLAFGSINWSFIASVLPQIAVVVMMALLTASFSFSALELGLGEPIDFNHELVSHGFANIASALCLGVAGSSDAPATILGNRVGGGSRILPLATSGFLLITAFVGGYVVGYVPKLVMGALAFVAALQLIYEYLIETSRMMNPVDFGVVWLIFAVIAVVGFIPGVITGIILMSLLFIVRYSKIDILASSYSLDQIGSSVERALAQRQVLRRLGDSVRMFNLRGFLFFGTANMFFERMKAICDQTPPDSHFIFNFHRVSGIDSTAAQVFVKVTNLLESKKIKPIFCSLSDQATKAFTAAGVLEEDKFIVLRDPDLALKWVEERLLDGHEAADAGEKAILAILEELIGDHAKAQKLASVMERLSLGENQSLFRQGDTESAAYIIESGTIEIRLETDDGKMIRLREFRRGSFVGEMAAYSANKRRSGTAVATEPSILYRLDTEKLKTVHTADFEAATHELIARLLTSRLEFMNERFRADL